MKNNYILHIARFTGQAELLVNSEIFKLPLNLSLTHLRAQSACYELKGDILSPVMLNEIFHDSLKISKFTGICLENYLHTFKVYG